MKWIKCPYNPGLRCYENNERSCPFKMGKWLDAVEAWVLSGRDARSLNTSAVLGGINIGGSEVALVRLATIHQMFREPEQVIGWLILGAEEPHPIRRYRGRGFPKRGKSRAAIRRRRYAAR